MKKKVILSIPIFIINYCLKIPNKYLTLDYIFQRWGKILIDKISSKHSEIYSHI